jgi:hypothetical protein
VSALVTVCAERGELEVPVARLFVASPSDPASLGPVLSQVVADAPRRPARVGEWGPYDDRAGRIALGLFERMQVSERGLPVPVDQVQVGERWRYTIVAGLTVRWKIEEPDTFMCWSGSHLEFDERCAKFSAVFW